MRSRKEEGELEYEAGPWRIPDTHPRIKRIFAEYGVELTPLATPAPTKPRDRVPPAPGLSTWGVHAFFAESPGGMLF